MTARSPVTRRILSLAVPALGALVAQPLFVLTDTAMVGHLGGEVLAGLSIGSTIITTAVGLSIFLAYVTTPLVARRLGAGDRAGAVRAGIDGMWLGLGLGVALLLVGLAAAFPLVGAFTSSPEAAAAARAYLTVSLWGLPGMLVVIAATGLLRGLQNTRVPLVVAVTGAVVNAALNFVFIYPLGLGVAGSALGTAVTETLMAAAFVAIAVRAAREAGVSLRPGIGDPRQALSASAFMLLRTATLRASMLLLVWTGGRLGVSELAALQITLAVFNLLAFALDALAIAAQAMIGHDLGAGERESVRSLTWLLVRWGLVLGLVLGGLVAAVSPVLGRLFASDAGVLSVAPAGLAAMAAFVPLYAVVFVLDGVLIGAGDARYLAWAGFAPLVVFAALAWWLVAAGASGAWALAWLWIAYGGGSMAVRAATLVLRARGTRWLEVGAG